MAAGPIAFSTPHEDRYLQHQQRQPAAAQPISPLPQAAMRLRESPVDAFQQITKLRRRDRHRLALGARPYDAAALQALGQQATAPGRRATAP